MPAAMTGTSSTAMWDRHHQHSGPGADTSAPYIIPTGTAASAATFDPTALRHQNQRFTRQPNQQSSTPYRYSSRQSGAFNDGFNALGINVRRDKAGYGQISSPRHHVDYIDDLAPPVREPPPRNPRRRQLQFLQLQQQKVQLQQQQLRQLQLQHQHRQQHQQQSSQPLPPPVPQQRDFQLDPHRDLNWRPTSSVYDDADGNNDGGSDSDNDSRASPASSPLVAAPSDMYSTSATTAPPDQISPPSSPDVNDRRIGGDVSPIDEEPEMSQKSLLSVAHPAPPPESRQEKSSIPMMRRDRRRTQDDAAAALRDVRSNDRQRQNQRRSQSNQQPIPQNDRAFGNAPNSMAPHQGQPRGWESTTIIEGPQIPRQNAPSPSFGQRVRQLGRSRPEAIENRPGWNGASGRTNLVQPVRDDPKVAPLSIPRRSSKRMSRGGVPAIMPISPVSPQNPETSKAAAAMRRLLPLRTDQAGARTAPAPSHIRPTRPIISGPQSYPTPPPADLSAQPSHNAATHLQAKISSVHPSQALSSNPVSPMAIKRKPPPSDRASTPTQASQISTSSPGQPFYGDHSMSTATSEDTWVQPPSRFSITTFATSNPGTPRQSVDEPEQAPHQYSSVMDRRRPILGGSTPSPVPHDPIVISMNSSIATSSPAPRDGKMANPKQSTDRLAHMRAMSSIDGADRRASIMSTSKPLPLAPPEITTANDRVAHLNAQLEGLLHRRNNINRGIKQMTELMPRDNLLAGPEVMRRREEERQKVEGLREELSEVQHEEYDLGLKLHRAYKRLDKDATYEPTTLWVRRVTG